MRCAQSRATDDQPSRKYAFILFHLHSIFYYSCSPSQQHESMKSLTVSSIDECIDKVLINDRDEQWRNFLKEKGFRLQRATTPSEWKSLLAFVSDEPASSDDQMNSVLTAAGDIPAPIPYFFGIGVYSLHGSQLCGVMTMYMSYSTWDGRCLFFDRLEFPNHDHEDMEKMVLRPLAKIAIELDCARLNWKVSAGTMICYQRLYVFARENESN
jgi:hypothetical protein